MSDETTRREPVYRNTDGTVNPDGVMVGREDYDALARECEELREWRYQTTAALCLAFVGGMRFDEAVGNIKRLIEQRDALRARVERLVPAATEFLDASSDTCGKGYCVLEDHDFVKAQDELRVALADEEPRDGE